jgi:Ca-activated chloride channel homolog
MRQCPVMATRSPVLLRVLICFWAAHSCGQDALQQPQPSSASTPTVQIFMTVSDRHGAPATPSQSELRVAVDKQPTQINALRSAKNDPLLFAVLVDTSGSDDKIADKVRKAALQIFQGLSSEANKGYLALFDDRVRVSEQPMQISEVGKVLAEARFRGGTAAYDAIEQICAEKLSRARNPNNPRRVILLISDGEDNSSNIRASAAEAAALREGVTVFALIPPRSPQSGPRGERFLKEISSETGGEAENDRDLVQEVPLLLKAIQNQWAMSFVPAQSPDQKLHSLEIKTSQKSIRVAAPTQVFLK